MKYLRHIFLLILSSLLLVLTTCKKDSPVVSPVEPPQYQQSIFLSVVDSGLTEVYLRLTMTDTLSPRGFAVLRNNTQILSGTLFSKETTIVDTTAQFNTRYSYKVFRVENGVHKDSSAVVSATTLDTTSHEYNWKIVTLGGASTSVLYDVKIFNKDNIWAVGEIFTNDSTGNLDQVPYSIVHWDGNSWSLKRLYYRHSDTENFLIAPIRGIAADTPDTVWFAAGSIFRLTNNSSISEIVFSRFLLNSVNGTIERVFQDRARKIYGVGDDGSVVIGKNSSWKVVETGTLQPITDIYGSFDPISKKEEILCIGSSKYHYTNKVIYKIKDDGLEAQTLDAVNGSMISIWSIPGRSYYIVGNGVYNKNMLKNMWMKENSFAPYYKNIVRGNSENNVFVAGDFRMLSHFNGKSWKHYSEFGQGQQSGMLLGMDVKEKMVVVVGSVGTGEAIIIIGEK